jgi:hypothetical protein
MSFEKGSGKGAKGWPTFQLLPAGSVCREGKGEDGAGNWGSDDCNRAKPDGFGGRRGGEFGGRIGVAWAIRVRESVNGYATTKYRIDSARERPSSKAVYSKLMRVKDYKLVGTGWVAKVNGWLVKYVIDVEEDGQDGSVKKTHYEGNVVKR